METVLIGLFKDGIMIQGKQAKIVAERCNDGIKEIKVSTPLPNSPTFKYSRKTRIYMGDQPTKMDPYEKNTIYINKTKWGDDGVFAKRDIKAGELVSYYSGIFFNASEMELFPDNQTGFDM